MAEPNDFITSTRKNFISNDNEGRMVKKCIFEIQGTFLVKVRDNAFNGNIGENAFKHIDKFLKVVRPIKINGLTQDRFRLSVFPVSLTGAAKEEETEEDDNLNETENVPEIFKIEGNLFDFETPFCEAFNEFNYLQKIDTDMFTYINGKTNWPICDSDIDGFYNGGKLPGMAKVKGSWGDAAPGVMKFCIWLKNYFENLRELDYDVLVKLQECWWKVNAYEIAPFTRMENFGRGPYANMKTKKTRDPYLDVNRIFGRNYEASNIDDTQENQRHKEHKDNLTPESSNYKIRRFKMMKYSFNDDEEYITIKESEYLNHSKDSLDAYRELLRLIDEGWVVTTPDE
ncbi:hypothetical protein Tco_1500103 [Tanacetum coccineum]